MSPFLKDASVESVLAAADIVDVVSAYTTLRKRGNTHTGLCPFHQEKTPSFSVSADKGLYYCFGCGEGGTVFTFLQRVENLSFVEAVESLAERYHVTLEYEDGGRPDTTGRDKEKRLFALLDKAAVFYERYLWEAAAAAAARAYLEERGLHADVAREFRVGLAPHGWRGLQRRAAKEGFTDAELDAAGLLVRQPGKAYDRFRGRLMFPLVDHRGRVVGFGGRTLSDETPKYVNSPEGSLYQKGRLLYGLYQGRKSIVAEDELLVVEGYTDVLALAQAGVRNVVASMGTSLTDGQIALMKRFTQHVTFMFDGDRAGVEAILRSGELVRAQGLRPRVVTLPEGRDPADVVKQAGAAGVKQLVAARVPLLTFQIQRILDQADTSTSDGRIQAFEDVRPVLERSASPKEREEGVATIADRLRLSPESISLLLSAPAPARLGASGRTQRARSGASRARAGGVRPAPALGAEQLLSPAARVERQFLVAAVAQPASARSLFEGLTPEHFEVPLHRETFVGLRDALLAPDAARVIRARRQEASDVGRFFVRLALEAEAGPYSAGVLREFTLRLQGQYLERAIAGLKSCLESDDEDTDWEQRLFRLELQRQQVRTLLSNLDEG